MTDHHVRIQIRADPAPPDALGDPVELATSTQVMRLGAWGAAATVAGAVFLAAAALTFLLNYDAAYVRRDLSTVSLVALQERLVILAGIGAALLGFGTAAWQVGRRTTAQLSATEVL